MYICWCHHCCTPFRLDWVWPAHLINHQKKTPDFSVKFHLIWFGSWQCVRVWIECVDITVVCVHSHTHSFRHLFTLPARAATFNCIQLNNHNKSHSHPRFYSVLSGRRISMIYHMDVYRRMALADVHFDNLIEYWNGALRDVSNPLTTYWLPQCWRHYAFRHRKNVCAFYSSINFIIA